MRRGGSEAGRLRFRRLRRRGGCASGGSGRSPESGGGQSEPREQLARGTHARGLPAGRIQEVRGPLKITGVETIPVSVPIRPELAIRGSLGAHTSSPFVL